ncbi:dihydrofolate reductase family protein [Asanoa sp. WMMD1127]|uniref:dihydrofolate reductase family protein n=1 Tax=Asanoa sp. WMMD1127 TaxID=3016107 RepID=UPI0024162C9E|nr:dihydrofolate reductase family protein [Asanoa sp. WMMD1127]MDG4826889.1 dihydrofolate reductase family protein [Asanoa sp. WMMD1127]
MARVIFGMTVSVDGYVEDAEGSAAPLYPDLAELRPTHYMTEMVDETGAVLMGRKTFAMGDPDGYAGSYEFQVPIFVVTHQPPATHPRESGGLTFTFVTDGPEAAVAAAKQAAGERDVTVVGGVDLGHQLLTRGLVDELRLDVMPVLLGGGRRLFEADADLAALGLRKTRVLEVGMRTSLRFTVST